MTPDREGPSATNAVPPGLCGVCRHARRLETRTGSVFYLCERAATDPNYPRYPALPVLSCRGFESTGEPGSDGSSST